MGLALLLVFLAYAPSLGNGWVWDDHQLLEHNPALWSPALIFLRDVFGPEELTRAPVYRPLVMATHALGQAVSPGPGIEHVVNLGLHLGIVALVAAIARRLGASNLGSWLGAAVFGVHAGASEPVFWVTGRHDLVPAALLLGGWVALIDRRSWVAGLLLALAPFCKEPYMLAPLTVLVWGLALRRFDLRAFFLASVGSAAYVGIRTGLGWPLPQDPATTLPFGAIGSAMARFIELLLVPASAAVMAREVPMPALGVGVVAASAVLLAFMWRIPRLAAVVAPLPVWAPGALASAYIGIVADRYAYVLFAGLGIVLAFILPRLGRAAWLIPALLVPITVQRGFDWHDDRSIFAADLRIDPENPKAAYQVGHALHVVDGDCEAAMPLYRIALSKESRAATNLQACLMDGQRWAEAAELGDQTTTAAGAMNTARAHAQLGDGGAVVTWAEIATTREPDRPDTWVLYGKALANVARWNDAVGAFDRALALTPGDEAVQGLRERAVAASGPR